MILDTSAIIDFLRGKPDIAEKIKKLNERNIPLYLTSIAIFEIFKGTMAVDNEKELKKIHLLLESLGVLSFDASSAKEAGIIHKTLKMKGQIIDPEDSMIAGIAKINREPILTKNVKHFGRIDALEVESY